MERWRVLVKVIWYSPLKDIYMLLEKVSLSEIESTATEFRSGALTEGAYEITKYRNTGDIFLKISLYRRIFFKISIPKIFFLHSKYLYVSPVNQS